MTYEKLATHELHRYQCPRCGKTLDIVRGVPAPPYEKGCIGSYNEPHGRKVMDVRCLPLYIGTAA